VGLRRSPWLVAVLTFALVATQLPSYLIPPLAEVVPPTAAADFGYEGQFAGESANVMLLPGQTQSFQLFFANTGTITWTRGSPSQVNLAVCAGGACNVTSPNAAWNNGWLSPQAYATHTQASVAPGSVATFSYNITAPVGVAPGEYRFEGELINGTQVFTQSGYAQTVRVPQGQLYSVNTIGDGGICDATIINCSGNSTCAATGTAPARFPTRRACPART